ncbi:MAG TPA: NERD domain-containing protein [Firmicutes bacterium]|nr:NERD domain-containing protein [Bacillota bacterium]
MLYAIAACILIVFLAPRIRIAVENYSVKAVINKLKRQGYYVLENLTVGEVEVSYLLVSKYGVHTIKVCKFPRWHNAYLEGDEQARIWHYSLVYIGGAFRPISPFIEGPPGLTTKTAMNNPVMEVEKAIEKLKRRIDLENRDIPFYPIVVFIPRIKAVRIHRKPDTKTQIIFAKQLNDTISQKNTVFLAGDEAMQVYNMVANAAQSPQNTVSVA